MSKDGPEPPYRLILYSISAATSISLILGPITRIKSPKTSSDQVSRLAHPSQLISVLHSAKTFDDAAIGNPTDAAAATGVKNLLLGNGEAVRRISHSDGLPVTSQCLGNRADQSMS